MSDHNTNLSPLTPNSPVVTDANGNLTTGSASVPTLAQVLSSGASGGGTAASNMPLVGVTNASNAAAGQVGEIIETQVTSGTPSPAGNGHLDTFITITLSPGDWQVSCGLNLYANGGSVTDFEFGISLFPAQDDFTGLLQGINYLICPITIAGSASYTQYIPSVRVNVSTTTSVYLKLFNAYTGNTPAYIGRLTALRVR